MTPRPMCNAISTELKLNLAQKMIEHIEDNHGKVTSTLEVIAKKLLIVDKGTTWHASVFYRSRRYFISMEK